MRLTDDEKEIIAIYVDDLLILTKHTITADKLKREIGSKFKAKDLGPVKFLLGQ